MSDIVINDDFTDIAVLLDNCDAVEAPQDLATQQQMVQERIRAEVAARSDGLRRAIVYYERLAEDAKRVMKHSEARAALIREYVKGEMQAAGVRSIKTATGSLTVRGNGGPEPLSVNVDELPDEYTKVTVTMPHSVWSDVCSAWEECDFDGGPDDLCDMPGVTIRTEPDNARIREALAKPCSVCNGAGGFSQAEGAEGDPCAACGGSGRFTIPGARLQERGQSLVVK